MRTDKIAQIIPAATLTAKQVAEAIKQAGKTIVYADCNAIAHLPQPQIFIALLKIHLWVKKHQNNAIAIVPLQL